MAMPQRDDPPTPSSFAEATDDKWLRRTGSIETFLSKYSLSQKRGVRMDADKFKNDLMIGETSSIEFKRFEMACLVVKHPVKVRYDT